MVEGPGCKLKGIKLKKRVKGQKVIAVSGNVIEKRTKVEKAVPSPFEKIVGLILIDVKTLGKELFALFENDVCLRVHFLMAGSVRYNSEPKEFGDRNSTEPRLGLQMSKDVVGFYDCAVELRSCAESIEKHDSLIDLDVCSPTFDAKRASRTVMEHSERLVCDVILDQLVLPGVGNIIKNEALFDAGINPNTKVKDLNSELIAHLVKMNRDFTNIFYKCREKGTDLRKHMRVYKKVKCSECARKLTVCKIGEYQRLTFFCASCQTNTIKTKKKLSTKNSLLGWVQTSENQAPWFCSLCTLENKPANSKCAACLTPKPTSINGRSSHSTHMAISSSSATSASTTNDQRTCLNSALAPDSDQISESDRVSSSSSSPIMRLNSANTSSNSFEVQSSQVSTSPLPATLLSSPSPQSGISAESIYDSMKRPLEDSPGESCKVGKYTFKRMSSPSLRSSQLGTQSPLTRPKPQALNSSLSLGSPVAKCSQLTSVQGLQGNPKMQPRNEINFNVNESVRQPQPKQFSNSKAEELSDQEEEVVLCPGHKKPARKAVVEKMNENRGRVFYACSLPQIRQCKFFMWADGHHPLCCHGKISIMRTVMKMNANNGRKFYCCPLPKPKQCDFFEWVDKKT